ncbi:protein phosphatase 2C domain-containing protein [Streptomyces sp. MJP52]|uniref:protein phosphatase 2C domain-containing protein n=1 Tax=Streptomyces sp. MJP52 TaxID=2940555 RepID=UPI002474C8BE|nr:protein phosphatase 2C domain-containing protein [Streptomyces sp. MJP52]MDH6226800.1 serine/threonine protein phosphatase PrpC [Streptomyces sp. MJP52]
MSTPMNHHDPRTDIGLDEHFDQVQAVLVPHSEPRSAPLPPEAPAPAAAQDERTGTAAREPGADPAAPGSDGTAEPIPAPAEPTPALAEPTPAPAESTGCTCGDGARGLPAHIGKRPPAYPPFPRNKPAVADDDFAAFTPDTVIDGVTLPGLTVWGASLRGDSHRWEGTCRQDAMVMARIGAGDEELLVLAVADGVGSSKRSHLASHDAGQAVIRTLAAGAQELHRLLVAQDQQNLNAAVNSGIGATVGALLAKWADGAEDFTERDYSTTLHLLLVPTDPAIRDRALVSIGDGGLLRLADGAWHGLEGEDSGIASTSTAALPSTKYATVSLFRSAPGELLLLGTDGITNPINQEPEFRDRLAAYWGTGEIPSMSDFLRQAQLRARTYDDDRTVICVWEGAVDR